MQLGGEASPWDKGPSVRQLLAVSSPERGMKQGRLGSRNFQPHGGRQTNHPKRQGNCYSRQRYKLRWDPGGSHFPFFRKASVRR